MSFIETFARIEYQFRPLLAYLPADFTTKLASFGKSNFIKNFVEDIPKEETVFSKDQSVKLWDIRFNSPLFNAAGMFKIGKGYNVVAKQGAGAFLAGTTTYRSREGNIKDGVTHPFLPFPRSQAAINWMGLPNPGHEVVAKRLSQIEKVKACPVGISLSYDSVDSKEIALKNMVLGLEMYDKANVDFIEINESCPNVEGKSVSNNLEPELVERLEYISKNFISKLNRNLPVIVKLSNDTNINQVEDLVRILTDLNYSGVNFGNTSTRYNELESQIRKKEKHLFYYFYNTFGGGLSGEPLKQTSLELASKAIQSVEKISPSNEFHVIRTGGISSISDIEDSIRNGIKLNQWYTGYFKNFGRYGHQLYKKILE